MPDIQVLVVDDSVVVRRMVTEALGTAPGITVVGTAVNGRVALTKIEQLKPDLVTMDIEMPELNGIETVRALRRTHPRLPVIMFSTLTAAGASATLEALAAGATDYVTKPANVGSVAASMQAIRDQLIPRIHGLCPRLGLPAAAPAPRTAPVRPAPRPVPVTGGKVEVLAIGCSTGGPEALAELLRRLPGTLPVPVVVVQHMPPVFTKMFADRLDRSCALSVVEATAGTVLRPGTVHIAPGGRHLEVTRAGNVLTRLQDGPPENSCRPAVDVLFRSVASVYRGAAVAVVLTGMGQDGKLGAERMRAAGAAILVQDEATSVVWGMPGAIATAGLADEVLPLTRLSDAVLDRVTPGRRPVSSAGVR